MLKSCVLLTFSFSRSPPPHSTPHLPHFALLPSSPPRSSQLTMPWKSAVTAEGQTYYHNDQTGETYENRILGGASPSPVSAPPPHSASRPPHSALLPSSPPRSTQPLDGPDCWSRSGRHRCRQCVPCSRSEPDFSTPSAASGDVPSVRGRRKYCAGR